MGGGVLEKTLEINSSSHVMSSPNASTAKDGAKKLSFALNNPSLKKRPTRALEIHEKTEEPRRLAVAALTKDVVEQLDKDKLDVVIPVMPNRTIKRKETKPESQTAAESDTPREASSNSNPQIDGCTTSSLSAAGAETKVAAVSEEKSLEERARELILKESQAFLEGKSKDDDEERKARESSLTIAAARDTTAGSLARTGTGGKAPASVPKDGEEELADVYIGHDPTENDYKKVSVDDFGYAMLRGMGWKPDDQQKSRNVTVKEPKSNLGRFGLGLSPEDAALKEALGLTKRRGGGGAAANESELGVKRVRESESAPSQSAGHESQNKSQSNSSRSAFSGHSEMSASGSSSSSSTQTRGSSRTPLSMSIAKGLRVRIVDKYLGNGKYYCVKGTIVHISKSQAGRVYVEVDSDDRRSNRSSRPEEVEIDDIDRQLETIVPSVGGRVLILSGQYRDERATVVDKDRDRSLVDVELENSARTLVRKLSFDDVCEYPRSR